MDEKAMALGADKNGGKKWGREIIPPPDRWVKAINPY